MLAEDDVVWVCQYCGTHNTVWVDLTVEGEQDFIEECRICCRPNRVILKIDEDEMAAAETRFIDE